MVSGAYAWPQAPVTQAPVAQAPVAQAPVVQAPVPQPVMMNQGMASGCYWVWHQPEGTAVAAAEPTAGAEKVPSQSPQFPTAGKRRENAWKNMSEGLGKTEVPTPEPAPT